MIRDRAAPRPGLMFLLLCAWLIVLLIAGGPSRGDALGQLVVRTCAWSLLIFCLLFGERPRFDRAGPIWLLLAAAIFLALVELVPLPPGVWQTLPGRADLATAATLSGQAQPWRPIAMVPGAARNAASSLIVPLVTLWLVASLAREERRRLAGIILALILVSVIVGLVQLSGAVVPNPFVAKPELAGGTFANRNHFALFLAFGCLLAPAWAFAGRRRPGQAPMRAPIAIGLLLLLALMVVAVGSRAGLLLGTVAILAAIAACRQNIAQELGRWPRWVVMAVVLLLVAIAAALMVVATAAGRIEAVDRILVSDLGEEARGRVVLPVLAMIRSYFPVGVGPGGFDPLFQMHEPLEFLASTHFHHVHNDFLEIALEGGLPAMALLCAALVWWLRASVQAWRSGGGDPMARIGSAMLLLLIVASLVDYPGRTPMIMAMAMVAAAWLDGRNERVRSALPGDNRPL